MLGNIIKSKKFIYKSASIVTVLLVCNSLFSCTNGKQLLAMQREVLQTQQARLIDTEQEDSESIEMVQLETSSFTRLVNNNTVNLDQVEEKTICPKWLKWIGGITFVAIFCGTAAYVSYLYHPNLNISSTMPIETKRENIDEIHKYLEQFNFSSISKSMS